VSGTALAAGNSVSGKALAAGITANPDDQKPVASAIPRTDFSNDAYIPGDLESPKIVSKE
jgi:hypothetical protein